MSAQLGLWDVFQEVAFKKAEALVSGWDFSLTVAKLQELDYAGWTKERAELAEKNYKRYLAVTKALDGYQLVPNGDVEGLANALKSLIEDENKRIAMGGKAKENVKRFLPQNVVKQWDELFKKLNE